MLLVILIIISAIVLLVIAAPMYEKIGSYAEKIVNRLRGKK